MKANKSVVDVVLARVPQEKNDWKVSDQQCHQQERPALPQLPGLYRQPQHRHREEGRHRGHLRQVRQDRGLFGAQGLRFRPVHQRTERPGGRGR